MKLGKKFKPYFKILLTLSLLLIFVYFSDPLKVLEELKNVNLAVYSVGVIVFLFIYPVAGFRWQTMTENIVNLKFSESIKVLGMSYGLNKILPLNSGDIARSKLMENYVKIDNHGQVLGTVALERLADISVVALFLTLISLIQLPVFSRQLSWMLIPLGISILLFTTLVLLGNRVKELLDFSTNRFLPEKISDFLREAIDGFNNLNKNQYMVVIILTTLRWSINILAFYIVALSSGNSISLATAAILTGIMTLVSSLPITPAGAGAVELSATGLLAFLGYSNSAAATIVILQRSLGVAVMALVGIVLLNLEDISLENFR